MNLSLNNISYYCVVGLIVSMDVMALTIARRSTYTGSWLELVRWAVLNAMWHAGLLAFYIFLINLAVDLSKGLLALVDISWIKEYWPAILLPDVVVWIIAKLRIHFVSIFAAIAISLVWFTYSTKIVVTPQDPTVASLNWFMRLVFRPLNRIMSHRHFNSNLQAALVAVDMLALAALIKANDQSRTTPDKLLMIVVVGVCVWLLTIASAAFARHKLADSETTNGKVGPKGSVEAKVWLLITLRLLEPLLIFYFLLELLAYLVTGSQVDSPALLFAAVIMVVAIVRKHGLDRICEAALAAPRQSAI